jgi:hypothetical protein
MIASENQPSSNEEMSTEEEPSWLATPNEEGNRANTSEAYNRLRFSMCYGDFLPITVTALSQA